MSARVVGLKEKAGQVSAGRPFRVEETKQKRLPGRAV